MMRRVAHRYLVVALITAALIWWERPPARGQSPGGGFDPRRTPAVEVFQRYKDSVICVTGPAMYGRDS